MTDTRPDGELPPELELRVEAIERDDRAGDLTPASWFWLLLFGVVTPAALLLWGWWA
ncbi:MAG TPA: hypothetical protein VGP20_03280 [Steroidobacteraceae bacterium]|jgi:hypothetical protein|nr:hypothetical protein [Steroidobacteraceae bacterium]